MGRGISLIAILALSACGGTPGAVTMSSSGPVRGACLAADRSAASPALCGCVQAVADASFSGSEQRRVATFFEDPHLTQELRQSDRPSDEAFWLRYKAFGAQSESACRAAV